MQDAAGDVLGVRLRLAGGKKISVKGGREGLFIPGPHPDPLPEGEGTGGLLLVCEGATDTAALLDLGFSAVGRPSCTGGVKLLVELVQRRRPEGVVIVADGDASGQRGAESLAAVLRAYAAAVRIVAPPAGVKDGREWKRRGATAADVQAAIDAAPVRRLTVAARIRRKVGGNHGR
jgi:DNA primase